MAYSFGLSYGREDVSEHSCRMVVAGEETGDTERFELASPFPPFSSFIPVISAEYKIVPPT